MLHERLFERVVVLSETDRIIVKAKKVKNRITSLVIVGITMIDGREHQIVRFDMSHGFLHNDLLFEPKGGKEKIFGSIDVKFMERIIRQNIEGFETMKRKYLPKKQMGRI